MGTVTRYCAQVVDDILTGLDNGARWLRNEVGMFGLICLFVSAGMVALILARA